MIRSISFFIVLLFGFSSALASSAILCKSASLTEQDLILGDYVRNGGKLPKAARLIDGKLQIFMDVFLEEFSEEFETLQGGYPKGDNFNLENGDSLVSRWTLYSEY